MPESSSPDSPAIEKLKQEMAAKGHAVLLTQEEKSAIQFELGKRICLGCPRCGNAKFDVVDGYSYRMIQKPGTGLVIGGPTIPCAITVCVNCGFVSEHALGVLGLMPSQKGNPV
jgi:hypothetical protein